MNPPYKSLFFIAWMILLIYKNIAFIISVLMKKYIAKLKNVKIHAEHIGYEKKAT